MDGVCRLAGPCPLASGWFHQWAEEQMEGGERAGTSSLFFSLDRQTPLVQGSRQLLPCLSF